MSKRKWATRLFSQLFAFVLIGLGYFVFSPSKFQKFEFERPVLVPKAERAPSPILRPVLQGVKIPRAKYPFDLIGEKLDGQKLELSHCLLGGQSVLTGSVDLVYWFDSMGNAVGVRSTPPLGEKVEECLTSLTRTWNLPRNPSGRAFEFQLRVWL